MSQGNKKPERIKTFQDMANAMGVKKDGGGRSTGHEHKTPLKNKDYKGNSGKEKGRNNNPGNRDHRDGQDGERGNMGIFLPLPNDVTSTIQGKWYECENFSLLFHRYIPFDEKWKITNKEDRWKKLRDQGNALRKDEMVLQFLHRQKFLKDTLIKEHGQENVQVLKGETVWRLAIGLGNAGPLETGITLHRLYGIPYLPGTAIKGVCRSWKLNQIADWLEIPRLSPEQIKNKIKSPFKVLESILTTACHPGKERDFEEKVKDKWEGLKKILRSCGKIDGPVLNDEIKWETLFKEEGLEAHLFCPIFGSQDEKGNIVFYDAYLLSTDKNLFEMDIINVHYQPYYQDPANNPPADYYNPVPNNFLTIPAGVKFRILLTVRHGGKDLLKTSSEWVKAALSDFGIGAKTAVGYGEMKIGSGGT